ncbi:probable methyltransferase-like protein 25 isoform X2 [Physella acuta]|nr:probable methyltransferase-like protein 25 isoform X2 [Physella acuta]
MDAKIGRNERLELVRNCIDKIWSHLEGYIALVNTHGAEFITERHWDKFVPKPVQDFLMTCSSEDLVTLPMKGVSASPGSDEKILWLTAFIRQSHELFLENLGVLTPVEDILTVPNCHTEEDYHEIVSESMSMKKYHEVGIMSDTVSALYKSCAAHVVIDFGSGKGYLSTDLARKHQIPVVGLDSSDNNTHSAQRRDARLAKRWNILTKKKRKKTKSFTIGTDSPVIKNKELSCIKNKNAINYSKTCECESTSCEQCSETDICDLLAAQSLSNSTGAAKVEDPAGTLPDAVTTSLYVPVTLFVDEDLRLQQLVQETAAHLYQNNRCGTTSRFLLTGLHTCGSLAVTAMRLFLKDSSSQALCCVGCCYQLMEESGELCDFPLSSYGQSLKLHLGRNARNLASQSIQRIQDSKQLQGHDFYWRALLNILLTKLRIPVPSRIYGMRNLIKRSQSFHDYARKSVEKLGLNSDVVTEELIRETEEEHKGVQHMMAAFFQLKLVLSPVIEALILLDRLLYLLEQEKVRSAFLVKLFEPVTSPRCYAIISLKEDL